MWKEIHAASRFGVGEIRLGRLQVMVLVVAVLVYVVAGINARPNRGHPGQVLQDSVRILGMYLGFIFLVIIALSASSRISREREHRTWDSLRTLPVSLHQILFAKWLGSIWSIGSLWYVLAGLWALTVLVGGMSLFALPMLVAAMMVYAAFVACVGLWFSAMSGSTMRAGLFTLLAVLLFLAAPGSFTLPTNRSLRASSGEELEQWGSLIWRFGLSPPTTLWVLSFRAADLLNRGQHVSSVPRLFAAVAGLHIYLGTTLLLWLTTCARLRRR